MTNRLVAIAFTSLLASTTVSAQQTNEEKLFAHSDEFRQEIIRVTDGVWVAVGYALSNVVLIEGDDGLLIVDTTESTGAAETIKAEFDKLTDKPVKGIVYTHNHYDHVYGASVFAGDDHPEIYAQEQLVALVERRNGEVARAMLPRNIRQFGITLPDAARPNAGIGPKLNISRGAGTTFVEPTITVSDRLDTRIAGLEVHLVHAPGETDDQLYVWIPGKGVLCAGDNWYNAFPNLYAIRGTPYRDVRGWRDSLDQMLAENADYLVPSHTRPVSGAARVREVLTDYRNAIDAVYTQTIAGMNRGLTPDELADTVHLPDDLAEKPYLQEFYGTIPWSVRSIYVGNLGWFDGNPTKLFPLPPKDRADKMIALVGGEETLLKRVREALDEGDAQWAAELIDHVLVLHPQHRQARALKAEALIVLGRRQISANGRNYYMTGARELGGTPPTVH